MIQPRYLSFPDSWSEETANQAKTQSKILPV